MTAPDRSPVMVTAPSVVITTSAGVHRICHCDRCGDFTPGIARDIAAALTAWADRQDGRTPEPVTAGAPSLFDEVAS